MRFYTFICSILICFIDVTIANGQEKTEATELTLNQLIQVVLERNQDMKAGKIEHEIADWDLKREWSIFEPEFFSSIEHQLLERENTNEQVSSLSVPVFLSENGTLRTGIEGLLPLGTRYSIQYNVQDLENNAGINRADDFESEYVMFAGVDITQPLLSNAGVDVTMTRIRLADAQTEISLNEYRRQFMLIIARAEVLYWELVAAQEESKMRTESVKIAKKILADNIERVRAGKMSELEIDLAKTGVQIRLRRQKDAFDRMITAKNQLHSLMGSSTLEVPQMITATSEPEISFREADLGESINEAMTCNPDYLKKIQELKQSEIRLVFARNQRWPKLDLKATFGLNGLGGTGESSLKDLTDTKFETWTVGLEFRMALGGGRRSKSDLETAKLRKQQVLIQLKAIEVQIANSIDTIIKKIGVIEERIQSYNQEVKFNNQLLEVELSKLAEGKSDSRRVLEFEEDLSESKISELTSLIEYKNANLELELVKGTSLKNRKIEIVEELNGQTY